MKNRRIALRELGLLAIIIWVLVTLAKPYYIEIRQKMRREEARIALREASQALEHYYTKHKTYLTAKLGAGGIYPNTSKNAYYSLTLPERFLTESNYRLVATPEDSQSEDACGTFILNEQGIQSVMYGSITDANQCW